METIPECYLSDSYRFPSLNNPRGFWYLIYSTTITIIVLNYTTTSITRIIAAAAAATAPEC